MFLSWHQILTVRCIHEAFFVRKPKSKNGLSRRKIMWNRWGSNMGIPIHMFFLSSFDIPSSSYQCFSRLEEKRGREFSLWVYAVIVKEYTRAAMICARFRVPFPRERVRMCIYIYIYIYIYRILYKLGKRLPVRARRQKDTQLDCTPRPRAQFFTSSFGRPFSWLVQRKVVLLGRSATSVYVYTCSTLYFSYIRSSLP